MNKKYARRIALITVACSVSQLGVAGQLPTAKDLVPVVINLHASNNATSAVTIWIPKATSPSRKISKTARQSTTKVISLPASNNGVRSITVRTHDGRVLNQDV
jgi:hypothetical protein